MTEQSNYSQKACRNMCGFFGTESNDGYCSVCYKKHLNDVENENDKASVRANSSPRQTQSAECILSSPTNMASYKTENSQLLRTNRVSPTNLKASLSEIACKIRAESISPSLKLSHDIPPMSALKSGSGMPGNQETFELPVDEEYEDDCDDNFVENRHSHIIRDDHHISGSDCIRNISEINADQTKSELNTSNESPIGESSKPNRCGMCKRKLGLTGFMCRCGGQFCSVHRYSDKHECSFDYKEYGQRQIRKNNPVVSGEKISKI
ncbi:hypothetical protein GJ496_009890 [Pomphorhynchus laevis]|nr:hypothetical protein GJ496_009890 [Pomphorhynchus laevis]